MVNTATLLIPLNAIRLHKDIEIWKIPNFATNDQCEQLITDAEKIGYQRSEVDSKNKGKTEARTSTTSFLKTNQTKTGNILGKKALGIVNHELEGIQVQKYLKTQKYNPHYDTFESKDGSSQRSWTLMIYLNDVEKGGGTYFPKLKFRIMPEKGTAILWNNLDSNNCRENKTLHMGEPVVKGEKYISTYWFRKNNETMCPQAPNLKFNMKYNIPINNTLSIISKCGCLLFILIIGLLIYITVF